MSKGTRGWQQQSGTPYPRVAVSFCHPAFTNDARLGGKAAFIVHDLYDMVNVVLRKQKAAEYGVGFESPDSVSVVPECTEKQRKTKSAKVDE